MIGFYDGLSHPVLGMDHFLAMVSVGIISAQIGGKAIWSVPSTFVGVMIIGGIFGITAEISKGLDDQVITLNEIESLKFFALSEISVLTISVVVVVFIKLARMVVEITSLSLINPPLLKKIIKCFGWLYKNYSKVRPKLSLMIFVQAL